jgi:HlyD family secretion protein
MTILSPLEVSRTVSHIRARFRAACAVAPCLLVMVVACRSDAPTDRVRVSGHVEATDVRLGAEVGGRVLELRVGEGDRVNAGDLIARLDTRDTELARQRGQADRQQADAQLRLLLAGSRPEDIQQAQAQYDASVADIATAEAELTAAQEDLDRFEALLKSEAGSRKQRDDARTRRDVAAARVKAARDRARAVKEAVARLRAGSRREEIDAARARLASVDAQLATLDKAIADATVLAPVAGIVSEKIASVGELVTPRAPIVLLTDLDNAWAEVFVDEPVVPRIKLGQAASVFTDAGGAGIAGRVTFISPKAEFTPRNVQTAEERSRLVYRLKVEVDNKAGVLKQGMPVEAEIRLH